MTNYVEKFYDHLKNKKDLLNEINHKGKEYKDFEKFVSEIIIPIAKKEGFDISSEEVLDYEKENLKVLSDSQLAEVSGGIGIKNLAMSGVSSILILCGSTLPSLQTLASSPPKKSPKEIITEEGTETDIATTTSESNTAQTQESEKVTAEWITENNIIEILHTGAGILDDLKRELSKIPNDNYVALNEFAREYFQNDDITLPEHEELAKAWIENAAKVFNVFPDLLGIVKVKASEKYQPPGSDDGTDAEAFFNIITYYKCLNDGITGKTIQVKNFNRKFTIVHELGHVIDHLLLKGNSKEIIQASFSKLNITKRRESIMAISPYAAMQKSEDLFYMETFAEALTDVVINGENANALSKKIVKSLVNTVPDKEIYFTVKSWEENNP